MIHEKKPALGAGGATVRLIDNQIIPLTTPMSTKKQENGYG